MRLCCGRLRYYFDALLTQAMRGRRAVRWHCNARALRNQVGKEPTYGTKWWNPFAVSPAGLYMRCKPVRCKAGSSGAAAALVTLARIFPRLRSLFDHSLQTYQAQRESMAAPCTVSELLHSPWQAPPSFFWHSLIERLLLHEPLRVALLCIAPLRLVCADWNAAVGAALPVLAPRPRVPLDELAAAATHLPGLRLLHIESPGRAAPPGRAACSTRCCGLVFSKQ